MIALDPIVQRLKSAGFRNVDGAVEFAGLRDAPRALPALYVVPQNETAAPNRTNGLVDQKVSLGFVVVLVIAGQARATEKVSEELQRHARAIKAALIGWAHPEASGATQYSGGQLMSADGHTLAWGSNFTASYHERRG